MFRVASEFSGERAASRFTEEYARWILGVATRVALSSPAAKAGGGRRRGGAVVDGGINAYTHAPNRQAPRNGARNSKIARAGQRAEKRGTAKGGAAIIAAVSGPFALLAGGLVGAVGLIVPPMIAT